MQGANRRHFLRNTLLVTAAAASGTQAGVTTTGKFSGKLGIPGPYPGRVVAVHHPGCIIKNRYQQKPLRQIMHQGMMNLTGAETPAEAWRVFFEPGDVVGVKVNLSAMTVMISSPKVLHEIIAGLNLAGVRNHNIVVYDRYLSQIRWVGLEDWLPEGVRWSYASDRVDYFQLDMDGYDADQYMELPLLLPRAPKSDRHYRRSYVAKFLTKDVNKMVNLCVLKHHQSAGVTLALKNMSHGLTNNVNRSHATSTLNVCGEFIPAVVDLPIFRQKVVLHILDGIQGGYHGGPLRKIRKYMWNHKTMYFATDPVALDKTGWKVIDEKRKQMGLLPVGQALPDADSTYYRMQPEHIEIAGALGLGMFADKDIVHKRIELS